QKAVADAEIATGRKSLDGPTNINLRSPEMTKASRPLNRYLRFEAPVEHKLKEIVILLTARFWGGQYVWYSHRTYAIEAGLSPAFLNAMAVGRRPDPGTAPEEGGGGGGVRLLPGAGVGPTGDRRDLQDAGRSTRRARDLRARLSDGALS